MIRIAAAVLGLALCAAQPLLALAAEPQAKAASTAIPAPFGLDWAISKEDLEARGIKLTPLESHDGSKRFRASGLTKLVAGVEGVLLDFGFDNRLWKATAISEDLNDPYGLKVKTRYEELNTILTQKYGKGRERHHTGGSIYDEPRYFLAGLSNGNGWHFTFYEALGLSIEISVRAKDSDTGFWGLIYHNTELEKGYEKAKAEHEKGAL